jgi:hypothetical protein
MATKKKGLRTTSGEWAKHLRRFGKKTFWRKERKVGRREVRTHVER